MKNGVFHQLKRWKMFSWRIVKSRKKWYLLVKCNYRVYAPSGNLQPVPPLGGHEYTLPEYLRGGGGAPSPSHAVRFLSRLRGPEKQRFWN